MRKAVGIIASVLLASAGLVVPGGVTAGAGLDPATGTGLNPATAGAWTVPFEEDPNNAIYDTPAGPTEHCFWQPDPVLTYRQICKPAAVNSTVLPDGRVLFWNGLEGFENIKKGTVPEVAQTSRNSQARVLDLGTGSPAYSVPHPEDGGATNPDAGTGPPWPLPGNNGFNNNPGASGDMFCSDQVHLANGMVLIAGGTAWYDSPKVPLTRFGVPELAGLRNTRLFNPADNTFTQLEPMNYARWYPGLIELGDGRVFVGGGVRKLIQTDGTNVRNTEIYNPDTGHWTDNGMGGQAAMPLFPRFNMLPNGDVYYGGVGQMWGPAGESADQALYTLHQSYTPATNTWTPYGLGVLGARSGAYQVMLPLKAPYTHADILTGGGTLGAPPGSYIANNLTEIASFDASSSWQPTFQVGPTMVRNRWYGTSVTLPNDAVAVFNGADKDEVVDPGSESSVRTAEWYAPWDGKFHPLSDGGRDRTYHNSAVLLPDGSILVGGHAPISADYAAVNNNRHDITSGTAFGSANNFRDPSFEVFRPPYMFKGNRPVISSVQSGIAYGGSFSIQTPDAANISSVRLIRLPADTHAVDGNMRSVELPIVGRGTGSITVQAPPNGSVAPPAPYYLFINTGSGADTVPSTAAVVTTGPSANLSPATIPSMGATSSMASTESNVWRGTGTNRVGAPSGIPQVTVPRPLATVVSSPVGLVASAGVGLLVLALAVAPRGRPRRPRLTWFSIPRE